MEINDLKSDLILRILWVIPLIILIGKACLFMFKNLKNKNKDEVDFEELVRRKTEYFKFSGEGPPEAPRSVSWIRKSSSVTVPVEVIFAPPPLFAVFDLMHANLRIVSDDVPLITTPPPFPPAWPPP